MRNRRKDKLSDDNSYEEKRRKRAENSEILRKIAEKFEKGKSTEKANLTETKIHTIIIIVYMQENSKFLKNKKKH